MRLALMMTALAALAACGDSGDAGPERKSAAGKVLGGEVTDDMLPLDTVRSTSPAGRSASAAEDGEEPSPGATRRGPVAPPDISGGAEPAPTLSPEATPLETPAPE